ncbi:XRE family transcriptional regulator, partial [Notoacmeibacter sp. MSK16QG-6]|nr:XRE family transcriptional regulator [Notoacmeibacter sp. MSK16QG-6]
MTATRVVHLAELLGFHPIELFCVIAPHFFGENDEDAQKKLQQCLRILELPPQTTDALAHIFELMEQKSEGEGGR